MAAVEITPIVEAPQSSTRDRKPGNEPAKFTPGDNPNKARAMGRKNYRPMKRNVVDGSSDEHATKLPFVDPVFWPADPAIGGGLMVTDAEEHAGTVDIRPAGLLDIGSAFYDATVDYATEINAPQMLTAASAILGNMLLGAVRSIYAAANDSVKTDATRFKGVYYYTAPLPEQLHPIVNVYGDMDTRIGRIGVKYAPERIRQLTLAGVRIIEGQQDLSTARETLRDSLTVVWDSAEWLEFARGMAKPHYTTLLEATRRVTLAGVDVDVRVPTRNAGETRDIYRARIAITAGDDADLLADYSELMVGNPNYTWFANPARADLRVSIGVRTPLGDEADTRLMDRFASAERRVISKMIPHLKRLWRISEGAPAKHGFAAQLVSGPGSPDLKDRRAMAQIPMSDADYTLGFMMQPASSVELNQRLNIESVVQRERAITTLMERARQLGNVSN
jgi:hypothetical protein